MYQCINIILLNNKSSVVKCEGSMLFFCDQGAIVLLCPGFLSYVPVMPCDIFMIIFNPVQIGISLTVVVWKRYKI